MSARPVLIAGAAAASVAFAVLCFLALGQLTREGSGDRTAALLRQQSATGQRAAFEAFRYAREAQPDTLADLRATMQMFSATQLALRLGGRAPLDRDGARMVDVAASNDLDLRESLVEVADAWDRMTSRIELLVASARERRDAISELERVNPRLVRKIDELVRLLRTQGLGNASTLALAEREAVWAERTAKTAVMYDALPREERKARMTEALAGFENGLSVLRDGGRGRGGAAVEGLETGYARGKLDEVQWLWIDQVDAIERLTAAEDGVQEPLTAVAEAAPELQDALARAAEQADASTRSSDALFSTLTAVISVVGLAAALLGVAFVLRFSRALRKLQSEAERVSVGGDDRPVAPIGTGEVREVSRSLERLRVSLQKAMQLIERGRSSSIDLP